ncbi:MAG: M56 family metallopeptidase, partial [Candidatus Aminicenantes bacterium]|nr:M56 family metallopeptidase [Candidatus Aminicenantes bacterium]
FHPAFHWLIRRIQLTREQVVDERVVQILGSRKTYLQSLVEIAKRATHAFSLPAPLFLEEFQLRNRVRLLLQLPERRRSKKLTALSLAGCFGLLAMAGWWSLSAFPLSRPPVAGLQKMGPAEEERTPVSVEGHVMARKLLHRDDPEYPPVAKVAGVEGVVVLRVLIDRGGAMQEAELVQGHPALRNAALEALKSWRWEPIRVDGEAVPASTIVAFNFVLKPGAREPWFGLWIDASGNLWDGERELDVELIVQRARDFGNEVVIRPGPDVPRTLLMDTVESLKQSGIEHVYVPSGAMEF